jgi:hypothetical protein
VISGRGRQDSRAYPTSPPRVRVDHSNGVARLQTLELGDDLAVELGVLETEHDQLDRSDRDTRLLSVDRSFGRTSAAASSEMGDTL